MEIADNFIELHVDSHLKEPRDLRGVQRITVSQGNECLMFLGLSQKTHYLIIFSPDYFASGLLCVANSNWISLLAPV